MRIAACIPAKGTSERVTSKNRQKILGVPLFLWAANNLSRVLPREDIYVDSDAPDILEAARSLGFGTIQRPADLSTNATDGNQLMLWQASNVEADVYIQHLPPMVFLREETIRAALDKINDGCASCFGVYRHQVYLWNQQGPCYDLDNIPNSVTLPTTIVEGMGFYAVTREALLAEKKRVVAPFSMIDLDQYERVDIDHPEELEFACSVAVGLGQDSPWTRGIGSMRAKHRPKFLVTDVDGVMTDGGMYYAEGGDEFKKFNAKDGIAIKRAIRAGVSVGFLSSGFNAKLIGDRAKLLDVEFVHVGGEPKTEVLETWRNQLGITYDDIAYVGDDVNDLAVMAKVGFTACPADAVLRVRQRADIVLQAKGGFGCLREFVDEHLELPE